MSDTSYPIEIKPASANGYFTPAQSNAYYAKRYARDGVTVHWWGDGTGADNHDNIVNYMNAQAAAGLKSVNYILSDNKITLSVSPDNVAWCSQAGNPTTISVETQPTLGAEGYKKWGWLLDQLEQRYGKQLTLYKHSDWAQTGCPGSIDLNRIRHEADLWKSGHYDNVGTPVVQDTPPPTPVNPYTIENITPKQVRINKNTHLWGLNYDNFTAINANPVAEIAADTVVTVNAILHHNIGYNYYLPDANVPDGYNFLDCDDIPVVPVVPTAPPTGAISIPTTTTYEVVVKIPGYTNSSFAINHTNSTTEVEVGEYYVFNRRDPAINITKTVGKPGTWINPDDNILPPPKPPTEWPADTPPAPAPEVIPETELETPNWRTSYKPFRNKFGDADPRYYVAMRDITVSDLETKGSDKLMPKYSVTPISGTFVKDGVEYGRPKSGTDKFLWYGIPMRDPETGVPNVELESDIYNTVTTTAEHQVLKSLTVHDYLVLVIARLEEFSASIGKFWATIKPKRKTKK